MARPISRGDAVAKLESGGYAPDRTGAVLRARHRDERRVGGNAEPLNQRLFDLDDIAELRTRLTDG